MGEQKSTNTNAEGKALQKGKKPLWMHLIIVLCVLAALVGLFFLAVRLYFRIPVRDYYSISRKAFVIPGTSDGYIAQGISYDEEKDAFFLTGYQNDEQASPIYVVDRSSGECIKTVRMLTPEGEPSHNHAGGISVNGDYVYVAGGRDNCLYIYNRQDILGAEDGETVPCIGTFSVEQGELDYLGVAFLTIWEGRLYLGEFYREQNYPTLESHKMTTEAGDYQQALALAFDLSEEAEFGIDPVPVAAYSLPDLVQGMCFDKGKVYLSTSYGAVNSHIYVYPQEGNGPRGSIEVLGYTMPLYEYDSGTLLEDMEIAPMSEEIVIVDDELYVLSESASDKYIFGKFTGGKYCYATRL